jgi:ATP-dependent helicase/nuclease subunit B
VLDGTAAALRVAHARFHLRSFGAYDGLLLDPAAIRRLVEKFGAGYPFSPSQIESYTFCPFQFFARYVLGLQGVDERDELDEDYAGRGSAIHSILEELETLYAQGENDRRALSASIIGKSMDAEPAAGSDVEAGLRAIEHLRLRRVVTDYLVQVESYDERTPAQPHRFEVVFEEGQKDGTYPCLEIGAGAAGVKLGGKIDRIDLVDAPDRAGFRVIDYKTGSQPKAADVKKALWLQLPLYALVVERIVLPGEGVRLRDFGYWSLKEKGYKARTPRDWEGDRARIEEYVLALAAQLRGGVFAVAPRKLDCAQRCEYCAVCRIGQSRPLGKVIDGAPELELSV